MTKCSTKEQADPQREDEGEEIIETWTTPDGTNVFASLSPSDSNNTTVQEFTLPKSQKTILYESYVAETMTPLDMHFKKGDDEYYDGTGTMVWLGAYCFCHWLDENAGHVMDSYIGSKVCELGCGIGLGGMAILLLKEQEVDLFVLFTDNDEDSLKLNDRTCALNGIQKDHYGQQLLSWEETTSNDLSSHFDTVVATDVLYDVAMIPPLMQSIAHLLTPGGYALLSHVPRFYLPRVEKNDGEEESIQKRQQPLHLELESHIQEQAALIGLKLVKQIRYHEELELDPAQSNQGMNTNSTRSAECSISRARMEEMHACLCVFQKD